MTGSLRQKVTNPVLIACLLWSWASQTGATDTQTRINIENLKCFQDNYDQYEAGTKVRDFMVVDFERCPVLPDDESVFAAILQRLEGSVNQSLGAVKFKDDVTSERELFVLSLDQASCLKGWTDLGAAGDSSTILLSETDCFGD
ncbi:MAG: hypothetical protein AAF382_02860 [Pseudomonadota bacterium]